MKKSLPIALAVSAGLVLAGCSSGGGGTATDQSGTATPAAGDTTLRVAFNQTTDHPQYIALTNMGERLSEATDGRYTIEVYPNETLGAQQETIQMLQDNTLEMAMVGGAQLENFSDDFVVFNLPFIFESQDHQRKVTNDPEIIGDLYDSLQDKNIKVLAGLHGGVRNVYNRDHAVVEPADMDKMKVRVQEAETHIQMLNLMGGAGTPMAQGEVYSALQSGVLDGAENNELVYNDLKHVEVAPYYSYTRHLMVPDYLIINPSVLDKMSPEDRAAFEAELSAAVEEEAVLWQEKVETAIAAAEASGAQFNEVNADAFTEILRPFSEESVPDTATAKELYEKTLAAAQN